MRAQIDGAGQTLADEARLRRFIHTDSAEQFGRILIVFSAAVVAGRDLFATVEQRGGEIWREAARC